MHFLQLRTANKTRQDEWDSHGIANDLDWRVNELAGEAGEACNVIKKLFRERNGIRGSRATVQDLAEELADVVICVDLTGMTAKLPAIEAPNDGGIYKNLTTAGCRLIAAVGKVAMSADGGTTSSLLTTLTRVVEVSYIIARQEGIDLDREIALKFNATSEKMGLGTKMIVNPDAAPGEEIPTGVYYDASDNTFYSKTGAPMGVDFWKKWRGQNHRFPTDLRTAMMNHKDLGNPQHDAAS